MVLGLQGYDALNKYGAGDSLASSSGFRSCGNSARRRGLLFASRAAAARDGGDRTHEDDEQLSAMEMMAVDRLPRIVAPALLGRRHLDAAPGALFSVMGVFGAYLVGVR